MLSPLACLPPDYGVFRIGFTFLKTQHFANGLASRVSRWSNVTPTVTRIILFPNGNNFARAFVVKSLLRAHNIT